jgi:hypothetical protein
MGFDPNINDMEAHLALLYDWTHTHYPDGRFEVRCIHPSGKWPTPNQRFACTMDGYEEAVLYAVCHNDQGYNVYVTINPLKPGTAHTATDDDVEIALYHFADSDGVAAEQIIERSRGFSPTFTTTTGTIPEPRGHLYWKRDEPTRDMAQWRFTQAGLAQHFGTDQSVKNPSRVDRLAGTVSYPPPHKQERGYVTEVTALNSHVNGEVCSRSFVASFPVIKPPAVMPPPITSMTLADISGQVPRHVVEAALAAIPPILGQGKRDVWLDIAMCVKDANSNCFAEFDCWQRGSDRYSNADSRDWPSGLEPRPGSFLGLFAHAKCSDAQWWSHDSEVYEWWCESQAKRAALEYPVFGDPDDDPGEVREPAAVKWSPPGRPAPTTPSVCDDFDPLDIADMDLDKLPPRRWLYGRTLIRGYVSCLAGDGGVGKTSLSLARALSVALGRSLLRVDEDDPEAHRIWKQGPICYYNLEDPLHEMQLRLAAELRHRRIDRAELRGNVKLISARDHAFCLASLDDRGRPIAHDPTNLINMLKRAGAILLFADPLVNAHQLDGNKNEYLALIIDQFRKVAHEADVALAFDHHFRKGGQAGDVQAALGAVTLTNNCRVVETLSKMSEEEATALGVDLSRRRYYVRLDNAKANLSPPPTCCEWYEFRNVKLNNGTEEYPLGDDIGVLVRWKPMPAIFGKSWKDVEEVLDMIAVGDNGEYYSSDPKATRWIGHLIMRKLEMNCQQAKSLVKEWLQKDVLEKGKYTSKERNNQDAQRLMVKAKGREELRQRMAARA